MHYPAEEQWRCFMAQYAAPFLTTPAFFAQDLADSWQLSNIYQLPCVLLRHSAHTTTLASPRSIDRGAVY